MSEILTRRPDDASAADASHGTGSFEATRDMQGKTEPIKAMGANVTIQKNWQELIRPNKLQVSAGRRSRAARRRWLPNRSSAASA